MPFIVDATWTPMRYRHALAAWHANADTKDSDILPRQAAPAAKPRHSALSKRLRALLTWRAMNRGDDWTAIAANDNLDPEEKAPPILLDSRLEQRPTMGELRVALEGVEFETRRHAKLGGGGTDNVVPFGGDIERGPTRGQGRKPKPDCIIRLGRLHFSNGAAEEPCLKLEAGKAVRGSVRIELGGLARVGEHRPHDRFRGPKGKPANDNVPTVGISDNCSAGAVDFVDPVADRQQAIWARNVVGRDVAAILDLALVAANFREIGEHLGVQGKAAERRGKRAVLDACAILDEALSA